MRFICLVLVVGMMGCATVEKYKANMRTWLGSSEDRLVQSWGVPSNQFTTSSGIKMVEYRRIGKTHTHTQYNELLQANLTNSSTSWCNTTFAIQNSIVQSYSFEGNNCKAQ